MRSRKMKVRRDETSSRSSVETARTSSFSATFLWRSPPPPSPALMYADEDACKSRKHCDAMLRPLRAIAIACNNLLQSMLSRMMWLPSPGIIISGLDLIRRYHDCGPTTAQRPWRWGYIRLRHGLWTRRVNSCWPLTNTFPVPVNYSFETVA